MRIAVDAGHGKYTAGKRTPKWEDGSFMQEWYFNSKVAEYLIQLLKIAGHEVIQTYDPKGEDDYGYNVRVGIANREQADLYVSIHANAIGSGTWNDVQGILFLANEHKPKHIELGQKIINRVKDVYPYKRVLPWIKGYNGQSLCKYSKMPTAIIECGFMTNKADAKLLLSDEYRQNVAIAIFKGINDYLGVEILNEQTVQETKRAVENLARKGFINNPEQWLNYDFSQPLPSYAIFLLLSRIVEDYGRILDDLERRSL